jgi:hypothetical protein
MSQKMLNAIYTIKTCSNIEIKDLINDIRKDINPVMEILKCVSSMLFKNVGQRELFKGEESPLGITINEIISKMPNSEEYWINLCKSKNKKLASRKYLIKNVGDASVSFPQTSKSELWFYWDSIIQEEFYYLLNNVIYSEKPIKDPFNSGLEDEIADMWINYSFSDKQITITLANCTQTDAEEIRQMTEKNKRFQQEHLESLGGGINYRTEVTDGEKIIFTDIEIPYLL